MNYVIKTDTMDDGKIYQRIDLEGEGRTVETLTRTLIDTCNQQTRDALIKLGWTPPTQSRGDRKEESS